MANLTKRTIDAIPIPSAGRPVVWYADDELRGLYLVAYRTGAKVFVCRFRLAGRRRVIAVGPYGEWTVAQARDRASEILRVARGGVDPIAERERARLIPTFGEWSKTYLARIELVKKDPDKDRRFLPLAAQRWGNRPLDRIDVEDVETFRHSLASTPTSANRALASIRACFSAAVRAGHMRTNPAKGLRLFREGEPRARVLSAVEMRGFIEALEREPDPHTRAAFYMLVETGARSTEVLSAKWADVSFEDGTWRIPSPKSGRPQVIPLASHTLARLEKLPRLGPYIVPGIDHEKHRQSLRKPWRRMKREAGIVGDVRIHDLRRTFGLEVARAAGLHVASKLLRHANVLVTERVYAPLALEDLRKAMEGRASILPFPERRAAG